MKGHGETRIPKYTEHVPRLAALSCRPGPKSQSKYSKRIAQGAVPQSLQ